MAYDVDKDIAGLLAVQKAMQRRSMMMLLGAGLVLVAGVATLFLTRPDPKCKAKDVDAFLSESHIPAAAIGMVCTFGPPLGAALSDLSAVPGGMRKLIMAKAVAENGMVLEEMCPGAVRALADSAALVPSEAPAAFLKVCDLSVIGVGPNDGYPVMNMAFAALVYAELKDSDSSVAKPIAQKLLKGL